MVTRHVAIIVGSAELELGVPLRDCGRVDTGYGAASMAPLTADAEGFHLLVLARHGSPRTLAPHAINYRANISLLQAMGAREIVAINTVGGIAPHAHDGCLVVPEQIIDYTWGRDHTFACDGDFMHADFSKPYDDSLRAELLAVAAELELSVHDGGVYGCTQGPRFESAAEIRRMQRDGCTVVGMTGMPEAALARELGMAYASVCLVVNPAAGLGGPISVPAIEAVARNGMAGVARLVGGFLKRLEQRH